MWSNNRNVPSLQSTKAKLLRVNEELRSRIAALSKVNEDLERASRAKDALLALVSYELRSSLGPMLIQAQLLEEADVDDAS